MKVSDLINELQTILKREGDLQVRLWCDHAQYDMLANSLEVVYIEKDEYMADSIHEDDLKDYPYAVRVLEIGAS